MSDNDNNKPEAPTAIMGSPGKLGVNQVGIRGLRRKAMESLKQIDPVQCYNRYGIIFDDSGSMMGEPLTNAKKGVTNFLNACSPMDTSVCIFPLNAEPKLLSADYNIITMYVNGIRHSGCTPLYETILKCVEDVSLTRIIAFSDGQPDGGEHNPRKDDVIRICIEKSIPVDTVYIGDGDSPLLQELAEKTGGIYMRFADSKTFSSQLKYLSPRYVGLLANPEIKARIEKGEQL